MFKKLLPKPIISLVIVWVLVFLGVFLRSYQADRYPVDNNDDGLYYVWAGNSFWDNPLQVTSHSIFDVDNPALIWRSQFMDYIPIERFGMKIVRPWFDHPPLGIALISLPARLLGYKNLEQIPHLIVRFPAIIASIFTLFLTYVLGKKLFGEKVGKLSLLFIATAPYFVVAHRQSFLENFITPLFLGILIYLLKYLEKKQKKYLYMIIGLSFLTGWFKVTGFIIPLLMAGWLIIKKEKKAGWSLAVVGIVSMLSYAAYGLITNKQIFLATILNQGGRGTFVSSFFDGFTKPEFYGQFHDGWYVLGFLLSFALMIKNKSKFFNWFFTGWLMVLFLTAGRFANSPWYRYPLFPFMSIAIGFYINKLLKKPNLFLLMPFFLLGLTGFDLISVDIPANLLRITTVLFLVPFGLEMVLKNKMWKKINYYLIRTFVIFLVILNIVVSLRFSAVYCSQHRCLLPQKIILKNE
ncbi:ArnT family glycosyltransferase [Patescibacteria group bacterium]